MLSARIRVTLSARVRTRSIAGATCTLPHMYDSSVEHRPVPTAHSLTRPHRLLCPAPFECSPSLPSRSRSRIPPHAEALLSTLGASAGASAGASEPRTSERRPLEPRGGATSPTPGVAVLHTLHGTRAPHASHSSLSPAPAPAPRNAQHTRAQHRSRGKSDACRTPPSRVDSSSVPAADQPSPACPSNAALPARAGTNAPRAASSYAVWLPWRELV